MIHAVHTLSRFLHRAGFKGAAREIPKRLLPTTFPRTLVRTRYGFKVALEPGASAQLYWRGDYEPGTLDVMRRILRPGDTFVDAGASVGLMSFHAANIGCRVLSFEPLPQRYALLCEGIRANGFDSVSAFNVGLGAEPGTLPLFTDRVSPSMVPEVGSSEGVSVPIERLGEVLEREGVSRVRMMKVDVEGLELQVLKGCEELLRSPEPPALCVEYGVYESGALLAFLRSLPYRLMRLRGTKDAVSELVDLGEPKAGDNLFCIPTWITIPAR